MPPNTTTPQRIELPTGLPVGTVNAYLFIHPEPVLVDTGMKSDDSKAALQTALNDYDLRVSDLKKVIISHPHIDHFGLAGWLAGHSSAAFYIFESARPWLIDYPQVWRERYTYYADTLFPRLGLPDKISDPILGYYREIATACDPVPSKRVNTFLADDLLHLGGAPWRVLHTPGHTSTLTCFYQPDTRQFLSTDMLLSQTPTPIVDPPPAGHTRRVPSLPQFLQSLQLVASLDAEWVYPGHGKPFTNHRELIQRQQDRIQQRKMGCLQLVQAGVDTVAQLLMKMYAHYPPRFRFAGLWMLIGYLDLLKAEGLVVEVEVDGVWRYSA